MSVFDTIVLGCAAALGVLGLVALWMAWSMAQEGLRRTAWLRKRGYRR